MMKRNKFFLALAAAALALGLSAGLTACTDVTDNPSSPTVNRSTVVSGDALDILHGMLYKVISVDTIDHCRLPVASLRNVDVTLSNGPSEYFGATLETIGNEKFVTLYQKKPMDQRLEQVSLTVTPKGAPNNARTIVLIFCDPTKNMYDKDGDPIFQTTAATRAADDDPSYLNIIGQGTNSFGEVGNRDGSTILDYEKIRQLTSKYFNVSVNVNEASSFEVMKQDYTSMMNSWQAAVAADFKHTRSPKASIGPLGRDQGGLQIMTVGGIRTVLNMVSNAVPKTVWSGNINVNLAGSHSEVNDHEYYMNLYSVKRADARLNMKQFDFFEGDFLPSQWTTFTELLDPSFVERLQVRSSRFKPERFFEDWGTDVITQGTFGGYYTYVYARKRSVYANSIDVDVKAHLARQKSSWMNVLFGIKPDGFEIDADAQYAQEDYEEVSGYWDYTHAMGGSSDITDAEAWVKGFDDKNNWRLISYRMSTDRGNVQAGYNFDDDMTDYTYPVEKLAANLLMGYLWNEASKSDDDVVRLSDDDLAAVENYVANLNALVEARDEYLLAHATQQQPAGRIILADLQMVKGGWKHGDVSIGPRVLTDPWGKKRLYFPIMANKNAEKNDRGYPLDIEQYPYDNYSKLINNEDKAIDYYFYYALASENECDGLVGIGFFNRVPDYYQPSGEEISKKDTDLEYVYACVVAVKKFDKDNDNPNKKITAVGISTSNHWDPDKQESILKSDIRKNPELYIMGSTGGTEMNGYPSRAEEERFLNFWSDKDFIHQYSYSSENGRIWFYGTGVSPEMFFSTKPLPIDDLSLIQHPKDWPKKD